MRALFKKRQDIFIRLIHDQAALTLEGLEALKLYFDDHDPAIAELLTIPATALVAAGMYWGIIHLAP